MVVLQQGVGQTWGIKGPAVTHLASKWRHTEGGEVFLKNCTSSPLQPRSLGSPPVLSGISDLGPCWGGSFPFFSCLQAEGLSHSVQVNGGPTLSAEM